MHSEEMVEAFNKLSQIANEDSPEDDIPNDFISTINIKNNNSKFISAYSRIEKFSKEKNLKIENQKRLKFLEELSELREKPNINASFNAKVFIYVE